MSHRSNNKINKYSKKNKIFEFMTLLTTVIGIVIGTGEFIKNDNLSSGHVLYATSNNAIMATVLWILVGILCIFMMITFIEIASSTTNKGGNGTTSNWMRIFVGRRVASFVSLFWIFLYVPIFYSFFSIATTEYILQALNIKAIYSTKYILLYYFVGFTVLFFFTGINTFAQLLGKYIQIIGTILKALPFLFILILGFAFPEHPNAYQHHANNIWKTSDFFLATGPILFSFDGFIFAANLQKETKNKDLIPKALFVGILFVVIVYILEAIALFHGTSDGSVMTLFNNTFKSKWIGEMLSLLIVFAILIGMNGNSIVGSKYILTDTNNNLIYINKNIKMTSQKSSFIQAIIGLIWYILLLTLGTFINKGQFNHNVKEFEPFHFSDMMSNVVVMLAFLVYISIMFSGVVNRFTKKVEVKKIKGMVFFATTSATILLVFISCAFYLTFKSPDITKYLLLGSLFLNAILFGINEFFLLRKKGNSKIPGEYIAIENNDTENNDTENNDTENNDTENNDTENNDTENN